MVPTVSSRGSIIVIGVIGVILRPIPCDRRELSLSELRILVNAQLWMLLSCRSSGEKSRVSQSRGVVWSSLQFISQKCKTSKDTKGKIGW